MNESRPKRHQKEQKATPVTGFFEGDRLELNWRYVYRPEFIP